MVFADPLGKKLFVQFNGQAEKHMSLKLDINVQIYVLCKVNLSAWIVAVLTSGRLE